MRRRTKVSLTEGRTIETVADIDGVTVVQSPKRARDVDVEVEVILVLGVVDPLEVANEVLMNVCSEWLGSPDLVIGGGVKSKNPGGSGYNLMVGGLVNGEENV